MKLSDKLFTLRKRQGMSQEEVAQKLGVSRQSVSRWEVGSAMPEARYILQLSKLFHVTADYLLHDDGESDTQLPEKYAAREDRRILRTNLTLIAIIAQAACLNVAIQPSSLGPEYAALEWSVKLLPLLACSVWMAANLRYEKDIRQRRRNARIELLYCLTQSAIALLGYGSRRPYLGTALLLTTALVYIFFINPRYMNRRLTKKPSA